MKLLVTGSTGFIGKSVTQHLLDRGHNIRALVRPESSGSLPDHPSLEPIPGDLTDKSSLESAVRGVEGVFHIAAVYSYWHRDPRDTYETNVDGAAALLNAAKSSGVKRVVLTSTVATLKWPGKGKLANETALADIEDLPGHYKKSKLMAEHAAMALNDRNFEVVVVNPTAPFGPGDSRPTPTGRIALEYLNNRFPGYVATGMNVCDVDDVAVGHLLAFERGRPGERYILGSENKTLREIYSELERVTGLKRRPVRIPFPVATLAGHLDSLLEAKLLRREPRIPLEGLRVAKHPLFVSCEKAVKELGLPQRPAAESLERSARWFSENGYCRATMPHTSK